MSENKKFLDESGVRYLWDKINQFFSQIGHRHETSDVNGLDEYMEENAKAIRDTEMVVKELSELPLYPSEEQVGKVYAYDGKLYKAKKLNTLTLDFSQIPVDEETGLVTKQIFMDFINQNGMNIVMDYEEMSDLWLSSDFEKRHGILYMDPRFNFCFEQRGSCEEFNHWNPLYIKGFSATYQSDYSDEYEESYSGSGKITVDDANDFTYTWSLETTTDYPSDEQVTSGSFGEKGSVSQLNYVDYFCFEDIEEPFLLKSLTLQLATCASREDYDNHIFSDFYVWEEISDEHIIYEDTTPASEDTRKRFYRELSNNNIYVTDADYTPGESSAIYVTHNLNNVQITNYSDFQTYIDPNNVWVNSVLGLDYIYGDKRSYINNLQETVNITPIRLGTSSEIGTFELTTKDKDVELYFLPYYSVNAQTGQIFSTGSTVSYQIDGQGSGREGTFELEKATNLYLENTAQVLTVGKNSTCTIRIHDYSEGKRCYLFKIVPIVDDMSNFRWEQIAKIKDVQQMIDDAPKPVVGDVQIYDYETGKPLPIVDETQEKKMYRQDNKLYTAVFDGEGLSLDFKKLQLNCLNKNPDGNTVIGNTKYSRFVREELNDETYLDGFTTVSTVNAGSNDNYRDKDNLHGIQIGSGSANGIIRMLMSNGNRSLQFDKVTVELESYSNNGETTSDNGNVSIEVGTDDTPKASESVLFKKDSDVISGYTPGSGWYQLANWECMEMDADENRIYLYVRSTIGQTYYDFPLGEDDEIKVGSADDECVLTIYDKYEVSGEWTIRLSCYINDFDWDNWEPFPSHGFGTIYQYENGEPQPIYYPNPVQTKTVTLSASECNTLKIYTNSYDDSDTTRVIIKSVVFETFNFIDSNNPDNNIEYKQNKYWKQISGEGGSIKVIDLT